MAAGRLSLKIVDCLQHGKACRHPSLLKISTCSDAGSIFDTHVDRRPSWKTAVAARVEGIRASVVVLFFTFLALFMDDFRLLALPPSLDGTCEVLAFLILVSADCYLHLIARMCYPFCKWGRLMLVSIPLLARATSFSNQSE